MQLSNPPSSKRLLNWLALALLLAAWNAADDGASGPAQPGGIRVRATNFWPGHEIVKQL
jgi:hypothetical protein